VRCIGTNKTPLGTYRGAGQPEVTFAMECLIDVLAKEIGLSAADLRARNLVRPEEMPYCTGTSLFGNPITYENADFLRAFATAIKASGYSDQVEIAANGDRIAYGIGCGVETGGLVNFESAHVRIHGDGAVLVTSGMSSQGQGQSTTYAQVCADALGVLFDCVTVRLGDTHLVSFGRGAFAARGAVIGANAVLGGAAQRVRSKALDHAATLLQCTASELDIHHGQIRYKDGHSTDLTLGHIARAVAPGGALFQGEPAPEASFIYEAKQLLTSGFSMHVAKVRLDPCTGFFRIENYTVIHDAGRAINRMIVDGQIAGGVAEGIGGAVFAEMIYDASGQPLTTSLADYLLATAPEVPSIKLVHVDSPTTTNPLGVRPVGEGGVIPVAATLTNALAHAIDPVRAGHEVALFSLPLKPDRVLAACQRVARQ
jgi:carbon-monoxide dehydrogenase large subunit